jgi:hypothetical protein
MDGSLWGAEREATLGSSQKHSPQTRSSQQPQVAPPQPPISQPRPARDDPLADFFRYFQPHAPSRQAVDGHPTRGAGPPMGDELRGEVHDERQDIALARRLQEVCVRVRALA